MGEHMRRCVHKPRKPTKSQKKSGKNRERHLKKKTTNIRTVPMRTCVHVHMLKEITVTVAITVDVAFTVTLPFTNAIPIAFTIAFTIAITLSNTVADAVAITISVAVILTVAITIAIVFAVNITMPSLLLSPSPPP